MEELMARGLQQQLAAALLDSAGLALGLSVWVAAPQQQQCSDTPRPDASTASAAGLGAAGAGAGQAHFAAALMLDEGTVPLRSFQRFVRRDSSHQFFSGRLAVEPGGWHRYAYLLPAVPRGCRRAVVLLRGRGPQPGFRGGTSSSGGSGPKFASAQLAFVRQADVAEFGAGACMAGWAGKQVTGP
ncbi:hypothetical protein COO60DRAFT_413802 [Scenedesmus sp. NREL 46B-D3]|nr:hypothetical protein COO60DRAFT_413802 [Scenedesmus sp. NREL 46B-D3]